MLGVAYATTGDFKLSISSYQDALKLNPDYFEVYNNMGVAYNDWNKPDLALSNLNKALKINWWQYAEAYNNIGNSYRKKSQVSLAIEELSKSYKYKPGVF